MLKHCPGVNMRLKNALQIDKHENNNGWALTFRHRLQGSTGVSQPVDPPCFFFLFFPLWIQSLFLDKNTMTAVSPYAKIHPHRRLL